MQGEKNGSSKGDNDGDNEQSKLAGEANGAREEQLAKKGNLKNCPRKRGREK